MNTEVERDDFLNLCAQTLGKAIARGQHQKTPSANS